MQSLNAVFADTPKPRRRVKTWSALNAADKCAAIIRAYGRLDRPSTSEVAARLTEIYGEKVSKSAVTSLVSRNRPVFADYPFDRRGRPAATSTKFKPADCDTSAFLGHEVPRLPLSSRGPTFRAFDFFHSTSATHQSRKTPMPIELPRLDLEPPPLNLSLFELGADQCKWPVSDHTTPMLFCGRGRVSGKPYCQCHLNRSIRLATPTVS